MTTDNMNNQQEERPEWETEFDQIFRPVLELEEGEKILAFSVDAADVKSFISLTLKKERDKALHCQKEVENGTAICGVPLQCHLHDKQIEHCDEVDCPECNLKAYNRGYREAVEEVENMLEDYFHGLIHIPSPELTLVSIVDKLQSLKPKKE